MAEKKEERAVDAAWQSALHIPKVLSTTQTEVSGNATVPAAVKETFGKS